MDLENNKQFIPTAEFLSSIRFKETPFYDICNTVFISTLIDQEKYPFRVILKGLRVRMLNFSLTPEHILDCIGWNSNMNFIEDVYSLQIQFSIVDAEVTEVTDCLPPGLDIRINGNECPLPHENRSPIINCAQFFKFNPNIINAIHVKWKSNGINYIMAVNIVRKRPL